MPAAARTPARDHVVVGARPKMPQQACGGARCQRKWTLVSTDRLLHIQACAVDSPIRLASRTRRAFHPCPRRLDFHQATQYDSHSFARCPSSSGPRRGRSPSRSPLAVRRTAVSTSATSSMTRSATNTGAPLENGQSGVRRRSRRGRRSTATDRRPARAARSSRNARPATTAPSSDGSTSRYWRPCNAAWTVLRKHRDYAGRR